MSNNPIEHFVRNKHVPAARALSMRGFSFRRSCNRILACPAVIRSRGLATDGRSITNSYAVRTAPSQKANCPEDVSNSLKTLEVLPGTVESLVRHHLPKPKCQKGNGPICLESPNGPRFNWSQAEVEGSSSASGTLSKSPDALRDRHQTSRQGPHEGQVLISNHYNGFRWPHSFMIRSTRVLKPSISSSATVSARLILHPT
jgi:hypothetical protein